MIDPRQTAVDLAEVRRHRILFLHHSVGRDLLAGLASLDADAGGGRLAVVTDDEAAGREGPALVHFSGGRNTDPASKLRAFAEALRSRRGPAPELAMMKLCYVDIDPRTDVDALFVQYRQTLDGLKREFPAVRFAHVTVPLTTRPSDVKSSVRRLLGLEVWADAANVKRSAFNAQLVSHYASDPIFDLSGAEAAGPAGRPSTFTLDGRTYLSLHPEFTEDGGHLNPAGQRAVAAAAARFLADALQPRR
jgi:hypothetical protein